MSGSGVGWYLCQIFTKFSDNDDNEYSTQLQMHSPSKYTQNIVQ